MDSSSSRRRLLILLPGGQPHRLRLWPFLASFREAPLTGTTLAALVPPDLGFEIRLVDASVSPVPLDEPFDLVAISLITGNAPRGYAFADHFRRRGATVVMGGVHVALRPDEVRPHADAIVVGFAEQTWPQLLRDWCAGALKPEYRADTPPDLAGLPHARRDLQKPFGYMMPNTVFATRGCRNVCDFCVVSSIPFGWKTRPVGEVVDEVRALKGRRFAFNDVNLVDDRAYAMELFQALTPLKKEWGGLATTRIAREPELLEAMVRSGCRYLLLGFESVNNRALYDMHKAFNSPDHYRTVCDTLHQHGITIQGCFIFGLDDDTPAVFDDTVAAVNELRIDIPRYAVYTPFPGTPAYTRLKAEGRILHEQWQYYDTQHTVIRPLHMTPQELDRGFIRAWQKTFTLKSILHRHRGAGLRRFPISFVGNLAYRSYGPRLARDPDRFPAGSLPPAEGGGGPA